MSSNAAAKLEPFLLMSKSAKGVAATKLIESATAAPGVFVFAELFDSPSIQELANNPQFQPHLTLLNIFSYGTYEDYKKNASSLPTLNPAQITKLKQLSIVTYATHKRLLPYTQLMSVLEISSIRALEDLIIDAIYAELVRGKLDQKKLQFEIQYTAGRDLRPGQLEELLGALQTWSDRTQDVLTALDNKLVVIDTTQQQTKQDYETYQAKRQNTVNEIILERATGGGRSQNIGAGGGGGRNQRGENYQSQSQFQSQGSRTLVPQGTSNLAAISSSANDYYNLGVGGTGTITPDEAMDLDEPAPSSPSKKKAAQLTPTSSGAAPRKRVRGGQ